MAKKKKTWDQLSNKEKYKLGFGGQRSDNQIHSKSVYVDFGKHRTHNWEMVAIKHNPQEKQSPHFAKLVCRDCDKHIAWLNQSQTTALRHYKQKMES